MTSEIHKMMYCSSLFSFAVGWWKLQAAPPTLQLRLSGRKSRGQGSSQGPLHALLNPPNENRTSTPYNPTDSLNPMATRLCRGTVADFINSCHQRGHVHSQPEEIPKLRALGLLR